MEWNLICNFRVMELEFSRNAKTMNRHENTPHKKDKIKCITIIYVTCVPTNLLTCTHRFPLRLSTSSPVLDNAHMTTTPTKPPITSMINMYFFV